MSNSLESDKKIHELDKGKVLYDAKVLNKVLPGEQTRNEKEEETEYIKTKKSKTNCNVRFACETGVFLHFSSLLEEDQDESNFIARSWDHSFLQVKGPSSFPSVRTDVVVFDRSEPSEFDLEKIEVKDDLTKRLAEKRLIAKRLQILIAWREDINRRKIIQK